MRTLGESSNSTPNRRAPGWLITYGDIMTLLLCFFVFLFSLSSLEAEKFQAVASHIQEAFGVEATAQLAGVSEDALVATAELDRLSFNKELVFESLRERIELDELEEGTRIEVVDDGVLLTLDGGLLFESHSASLRAGAIPLLEIVSDTIEASDVRVVVGGHTDDLPFESATFPSNWELSSARAGAVASHLESLGTPGARFEAVGYADTRPIAANTSATNRRENRRVELLLKSFEKDR